MTDKVSTVKKKTGRPAIYGKRISIASRLTVSVYDHIVESAKANNRSFSAEVESRLELSFALDEVTLAEDKT